jgi:serine/threonine protein kinase
MTEDLDQSAIHHYALPIGTRIKQYVIEKLLGHGAFGLVYLARDESLECQVAIKEYLPEQLATRTHQGNTVSPNTGNTQSMFTEWRNNFIREAQQIAQLDHTAIVRVMQVFEANNTAYMVMPYYTGESLKRFQNRTHKRWNEAELNTFLEPLLNALELLHQKNILHRDIAPDNIFLKDNGQPILIDFGAARHIESKYTQSQNLLFKHGYSPLEHYSVTGKSQAGPWTDIYSLAAVVYELATGKKVHPATDRPNAQPESVSPCWFNG